jgi:hypothetical protein
MMLSIFRADDRNIKCQCSQKKKLGLDYYDAVCLRGYSCGCILIKMLFVYAAAVAAVF